MTTAETITLQRLLDRRQMAGLLAAFAGPRLGLALLRSDGKVFASAGAWPPGELEAMRAATQAAASSQAGWPGGTLLVAERYRCYPLFGEPSAATVGLLVAHSNGQPAEPAMEEALYQSLASLLAQGLEKRAIANETLERYREINLLYRIGETIGACLDPVAIPALVLDETNRVISADTGVVLLAGDDAEAADIRAVLGRGDQAIELHEIAEDTIRLVEQTGRPAIVAELPAISADPDATIYASLLCAPLKAHEKVLGHIVLGRFPGRAVFTASDEKLLMALAGQTAIAVENARLHQATLQQERMARELQLAYNVQSSLIPRQAPQAPGWQFAAWWQPANEVSGDFYDFLRRDERQLGLVMADVSDKGMAAALFMALTRSIVRASTLASASPADGLTRANRLVCADSIGGMFVTLFYGQLDLVSGELRYVNCGHNPPLHYRAATGQLAELEAANIMLGFDDTWQFSEHAVQLAPGDFVVFFTDGVTEAVSPAKERFEEARLQAVLRQHAQASAQDLLRAIQAALYRFMDNWPAYDDITLMIVKCL